MRRSLAFVVILVGLALPVVSAEGSTAKWSKHHCNVVAVMYARTHHTSKAAYARYLKRLNKQHGCKFKVK